MTDWTFIVCIFVIIVKLANSSDSLFDEELYERVLNNVSCAQHLQEINIMQFYDASGRVPQSITLGGQGSLGNYRQCLSLAQKLPNDTINGKYCIVQVPLDTLKPPDSSSLELSGSMLDVIPIDGNATEIEESLHFKRALRVIVGGGDMRAMPSTQNRLFVKLALCIPESCTTQEAIGRYTDILNVTYQDQYCRLPNDKVFSAVDYVAVYVYYVTHIKLNYIEKKNRR